jgi:hypothetical protein
MSLVQGGRDASQAGKLSNGNSRGPGQDARALFSFWDGTSARGLGPAQSAHGPGAEPDHEPGAHRGDQAEVGVTA